MRFQVFFLTVSRWVPLSQMAEVFYDNMTPGFALFICYLILVSFCDITYAKSEYAPKKKQ